MSIQEKIEKVREEKFFKDLSNVYNKLEQIVKDECDTSLEQFFYEYITLKKKYS